MATGVWKRLVEGGWLVRCMWLGMLANKMLYKTTILNVVSPPRAERREVTSIYTTRPLAASR